MSDVMYLPPENSDILDLPGSSIRKGVWMPLERYERFIALWEAYVGDYRTPETDAAAESLRPLMEGDSDASLSEM